MTTLQIDTTKYATCEDCGREMKPGTACIFTHIQIDGKYYLRDTSNIIDGAICPDCNAPWGGPHHCGCDNERCPKCGGQLISCDCVNEDTVVCYIKEKGD